MLLHGQLLDQLLVEPAPLGCERDHPVAGVLAVGRFERGRDHVDPEDHAGAAAVRVIVDLAVPERRRVAVVEEPELELGAEDGSDGALLGEPGERVRDEREDIDLQARESSYPSVNPV